MNQAELCIDLDSYRNNLEVMTRLASGADVMAIVKANAYGHGMIDCARAAREVGVGWLGVATPAEALSLRAAGDSGPLFCWLASPGAPYTQLISGGIDVAASSSTQLAEIIASGEKARVHIKVDTGLNRNGVPRSQWADIFTQAAKAQHAGKIEVVGLWSHLAAADQPDHLANDSQEAAFDEAIAMAAEHGLQPEWIHIANSAATVTRPSMHRDLVRVGIATYGVNPDPQVPIAGLVPVMTARARLVHVKNIKAGDSVSYGWRWTASEDTSLGLVPVGYGDGISRAASPGGWVGVAGQSVPIRGTICMDQFVVDLGNLDARPGDWVTIFGQGTTGEPTAEVWAQASHTIGYEVVTRMTGRWTRVVRGH